MSDGSTSAPAKFDNAGQYSRQSILRYEFIFGSGYVSTGGPETTDRLCALLGDTLKPGVRVLDVGSGLGGAAFHLADRYGAEVTGIDLAEEMIAITRERLADRKTNEKVQFLLDDVMTADLPLGGYDVVWSRDAFMHLDDKTALYRRLRDLLADGGEIAVTDYAQQAGQTTEAFQTYVQNTRYHLIDPESYANVLREIGFGKVQVQDATADFDAILAREMNRLGSDQAAFLERFPQSDYDYLMRRWAMKRDFIAQGDMKWVVVHAVK